MKIGKFLIFFLMATLLNFANAKPLTVVLDWFANPDHAPIFVAKQQGYFKAQGLDVKLINPADSADPPKLVAANKADIAITYQPQFLLQVSQGLPLTRIGTLIATPLNALVVLKKSSIYSLKDLKGKKIGYSSGGADLIALRTFLKQAHLSEKDVTLINVHYDLTQALLSGKVDAVTGMMRNFELIQLALAGKPGRAFYPEEHGIPLYNELIFVANRQHLSDPRLAKFITAVEQGAQYLINHPKSSWQTFAKNHPELNNPLNQQAWMATLPRFALRPAALDQKRFLRYAQFLQENGMIKTLPPLSQYAVNLTE